MADGDSARRRPAVSGYEDLEEIGRGGYAVVYRARQLGLGTRVVALKILTSIDLDGEAQRRFIEECSVLGSLSWHPNIVTVHVAGLTDDGVPYLAMEYLDRGSLGDHVEQNGPVHWEQVLSIGVQLCGSLAVAHAEGVLHRDVKPENVLMGLLGEPQLADFGIAAREGVTRTTSGVITATVAHAAPEVLEGGRASELSDVYSLASTLYTLLVGHPPFVSADDESWVALALRVTTEPAPDLRPQGVPPPLADAIESGLRKDPAERPGSAQAFGERLQRAQQELGVGVTELHIVKGAPTTVPPPASADGGEATGTTPTRRGAGLPPTPSPPVDHTSGSETVSGTSARRVRRLLPVIAIFALVIGLVAWLFTASGEGSRDDGAPQVSRLEVPGGADRYETAALFATRSHPDGTPAVVLTSGRDAESALSGALLAGQLGVPLLYSGTDELHPVVPETLAELGTERVHVVDLGPAMAWDGPDLAERLGAEVERHRSSHVLEFSMESSRALLAAGEATRLVVAPVTTGDRSAVLALGPLLGRGDTALVAGPGGQLDTAVERLLTQSVEAEADVDFLLLGAVEDRLAERLTARCERAGCRVTRINGPSRSEIAVDVARYAVATLGWEIDEIILARGDTYPDALSGGLAGAQLEAPVLLSEDPETLGAVTAGYLRELDGVKNIRVLGDDTAVSEAVVTEAVAAVEGRGTP